MKADLKIGAIECDWKTLNLNHHLKFFELIVVNFFNKSLLSFKKVVKNFPKFVF